MLGAMTIQGRALPGGWVRPIGLVWFICVLVWAWVSAHEAMDSDPYTHSILFLVVTSALGAALGVALARQGRTRLIPLAVVPTALLAMFVASIAETDLAKASAEESYPAPIDAVLSFFFVAVLFAAPIYAGAFVWAIWRGGSASSD
jgi:hypothetical protein